MHLDIAGSTSELFLRKQLKSESLITYPSFNSECNNRTILMLTGGSQENKIPFHNTEILKFIIFRKHAKKKFITKFLFLRKIFS